VTILNDGTRADDVLNEGCGADFVKVGQKAAKHLDGFVDGERCASIDGDADRLVYFYTDKESIS
jgi:phosphoacetylglucosamine mutase